MAKKRKGYRSMKRLLLDAIMPILFVVTVIVFIVMYMVIKANVTVQIEKKLETTDTFVEGCNSFYVVFTDGTTWSRDGIESFPEYLEEEWYTFALTCDEAQFDECSFYTEDGFTEYSVTTAKNIKDANGKVKGIVATDIVFSAIRETILEKSQDKNGKFILLDQRGGMIIAASDEDLEGVYIDECEDTFISALAKDIEADDIQKRYNSDNGKQVVMNFPIEGTEWLMVVYENEDDALAALDSFKWMSLLGILAIILSVGFVASIIVDRQMRRLTVAQDNISVLSDGDLTLEINTEFKGPENEITDINKNLKRYVDQLNSMISEINLTSQTLGDHATKFGDMAVNMNHSAIEEKDSLNNLETIMKDINQSVQDLYISQ